MRSEAKDAAKLYLSLGWLPIPCFIKGLPGGKKVADIPFKWKEDLKGGRPSDEEILKWWDKWPGAGVAILTGKISGLTVVDTEKGADLAKLGLDKTDTVSASSGGGGKHFYFSYDPSITNSVKFAPLHDTRNDGGLVFAPPSDHPSGGKYVWIIPPGLAELKPVPEKVKKAFASRGNGQGKTDWDSVLNGVIEEGSRNATATSVAGKLLLRFAESEWESQAWPLLLSWNISHNRPPLDEQELRSVFGSIARAEKSRRSAGSSIGEPSVETSHEDFIVHIPIQDGFAVFRFRAPEVERHDVEAQVACHVEIPGVTSREFEQRLNVVSGSSKESYARQLTASFGKDIKWPLVLSQACTAVLASLQRKVDAEVRETESLIEEPTSYLLPPYIEEGGINLFFGQRSSAKTFLTIRMMMSCVSGLPFMGVNPDKRGKALFLDYESTPGKFKNRVRRLSEFVEGWDRTYEKDLLYLRAKGRPVPLMLDALRRIIHQHGVNLLVIDSAAKACDGPIEESRTATRLSSSLDKLGITTLVIGHVAKGDQEENNIFGSSFFMNDCRNAWNAQKVTDEDDARLLRVGLHHRKTNNAMTQAPRAARVFFVGDDGGVDISFAPMPSGGMSVSKRIITALEGDGMNLTELRDALPDVSGTFLKKTLSVLKESGKVEHEGFRGGKWRVVRKTDGNYVSASYHDGNLKNEEPF